ncbi:MAG: adenine deaminase [Candidatus Gastranaerophilales bacterium]|nr:adenine deaminase [Candidatus Gastranaerophilales bacterium]
MQIEDVIKVAKGDTKADLVIKNAKLVNVLSEEIHNTDIAIVDGVVAGIGEGYEGVQEIDVRGAYVSPSFIDGHVHIESSMLLPSEFARAVVPAGTTTVVSDPHEISNVFGLHGISFMKEAVSGIPLSVFVMLPSCVPATNSETSGFELSAYDLSLLIDSPWVLGIAEMMNFPGVLSMDKNVMAKLDLGKKKNKRIDGHAPLLSGKDLCAYVAAGIKSDHECTNPAEAIEKIRKGMYLQVREGSAAKDLDALIPILEKINTRKCFFVTDDRHPTELYEHINSMVRRCVAAGISPVKAIQMASLNAAEYFDIKDVGAIAPGYKADFVVLEDLKSFKPKMVFKGGIMVAKEGKMIEQAHKPELPTLRGSVNVKWIEPADFKIPAEGDKVRAIEVIPNQLVTKSAVAKIKVVDDYAEANLDDDVLKIVVIERHRASGNIGKGFVKGFGLKSGAIASTVAHDSHNMIIIGTNDADMHAAGVELVKYQGGKVIVKDGEVISSLPLPVAGLMSDETFEFVLDKCHELKESAKKIGCSLDDPFMSMAFLSLSVIPELKITDKGVVDVMKSKFVDIFDI